jgi:hypothetical protein
LLNLIHLNLIHLNLIHLNLIHLNLIHLNVLPKLPLEADSRKMAQTKEGVLVDVDSRSGTLHKALELSPSTRPDRWLVKMPHAHLKDVVSLVSLAGCN